MNDCKRKRVVRRTIPCPVYMGRSKNTGKLVGRFPEEKGDEVIAMSVDDCRVKSIHQHLLNIQPVEAVIVSSSDPSGGMWDLSVEMFERKEGTTEELAVRIASQTEGTIHRITTAERESREIAL